MLVPVSASCKLEQQYYQGQDDTSYCNKLCNMTVRDVALT